MSRQQLLHKLLIKVEKNNQYLQIQQESSSSPSPPTARRAMLLGVGRIQGDSLQKKHSNLNDKNEGEKSIRAFVLQKVRNADRSIQFNKSKTIGQEINGKGHTILSGQDCSINSNICHSLEKKYDNNNLEINSTEKKIFCIADSIKKGLRQKEHDLSIRTMRRVFKSNETRNLTGRTMKSEIVSQRKGRSFKEMNQSENVSFLNVKDQQSKSKLIIRKQINKNYQKPFEPPPKISAKSYIIYEETENAVKIHAAFNSKVKAEIASLTKIMTCITAIELCEEFSISCLSEQIKIGKFQSCIGGTTANIHPGEIYTLHDLLHGLMLPSGNDASLAIAVWGGNKMIQKQTGNFQQKRMKKECYDRFIREMNKKSKKLGLSKTTYANSHGLVNTLNRSCAHDVAILSHYCMKNQLFRRIVSCREYVNKIKIEDVGKVVEMKPKSSTKAESDQQQNYSDMDSEVEDHNDKKKIYQKCKDQTCFRQIRWQNTHKLLHKFFDEYIGIKTGVTTAAGPCLSTCVQTICGRKFYIVLLNCKKLSLRFKETQILKRWVYKKEGIIKKSKNPKQRKQKMFSECESLCFEQFEQKNEYFD